MCTHLSGAARKCAHSLRGPGYTSGSGGAKILVGDLAEEKMNLLLCIVLRR